MHIHNLENLHIYYFARFCDCKYTFISKCTSKNKKKEMNCSKIKIERYRKNYINWKFINTNDKEFSKVEVTQKELYKV